MIIGIRVDSENIRTGEIKHCNSSYFTMVAKDDDGKNVSVPGLILSNYEEIRRFYNCIKLIALKKDRSHHEEVFDYKSAKALSNLNKYNIKLQIL